MNSYLVSLSKNEKQFFLYLAILILFIFVVAGLIKHGLSQLAKRYGEDILEYTHKLVEQNEIKNTAEFRSEVFKRENQRLFRKSWKVILIMLTNFIYLVFAGYLTDKYKDMVSYLNSLSLDIKASYVKVLGINIMSSLPTISKREVIITLDSLIVYETFFILAIALISFVFNVFIYKARLKYSNVLGRDIFNKLPSNEQNQLLNQLLLSLPGGITNEKERNKD